VTRPVVGVTTSLEEMTSDGWTELTAGTPATYVSAVQRAGGRAVLLPPDEQTADALDGIDALLVTGAAGDTDPAHYGAEPHPRTDPVAPTRDRFELAVTRAALDAGLPVLGVCRGMHVLNVALGGTLEQHLPDVVGHGDHAGTPGVFAEHDVRLEHGSLAARAVGAAAAHVKSYHHQGVREVGAGLRATGWASRDGLVEAIEADDGFVLGVLWHPEEDDASEVIGALVRAAGERRSAPAA
jgi:gamma-glutamyl-gamma-aminobutyrate hydrolase PuuD